MLAVQSRRAVLPAELSSTCRPFPRHSRSSPPAHPSPGVLRLTGCGDPRDQAPGTLGPVGQAHPPPWALLPAGACLGWRGSPVQRASRHHAPGQGARSACPLCSSTASPAARGVAALTTSAEAAVLSQQECRRLQEIPRVSRSRATHLQPPGGNS